MSRIRAPYGGRLEARSSELGGHNHFTCPTCGGDLRYTKDSRLSVLHDGVTKIVRRRRECSDCGTRHATIELLEVDVTAAQAGVLGMISYTLQKEIEALIALRDQIEEARKT
jgi:hypothetical protein